MRILAAIEILMNSISIANGYKSNVLEVSFNAKNWRDKTRGNTPTVFIVDDVTSVVRHAGHVREYTWSVSLFCVLRDASVEEFEDFIADLETAVYDNNTLFGQVNKIEINEIMTDGQLFAELTDTGTKLVSIDLDILYTRDARSATADGIVC